MGYIYATIVGALGVLVALLFRDRANVHDHGSRADGIGNGLADSQARTVDIGRKIDDASITASDVAKHIDTASASLDRAIGVVQSIRRRGATSSPVAQAGLDRD